MVEIAIIAGAVALIATIFIIVRWGKLPPWTHRDVLAFVALCSTIGGAMILTFLKWAQTDKFNEQADRLISELVRERPSAVNDAVGRALSTIIDSVTWSLKLDSVGIIVVLLSLGLVISARTIKAKVLGNELEMGTGDSARAAAAAAQSTAGAAQEQADAITDSVELPGRVADPPPPPDVDAAPTARP